MPLKLKKLMSKYRALEKQIIVPKRAPGIFKSEVVVKIICQEIIIGKSSSGAFIPRSFCR